MNQVAVGSSRLGAITGLHSRNNCFQKPACHIWQLLIF